MPLGDESPLIISPGIIGIGLVWGWLIGRFKNPINKPLYTILALCIGTVAITLQIIWLTDIQNGAYFLASTGVSAISSEYLHSHIRQPKERNSLYKET